MCRRSCPSQQNFAEEERYVNRPDLETVRIPERKLWRLDSNTEIELDKVHGNKSRLDLDLRIPSRVRPQHTDRIQEDPETTKQSKWRFNQTLCKTMAMKKEGKKLLKKDLKKVSKEEMHLRIDILPNKSVVHRSRRSKERLADMDRRSKSNRQLR